jgi:hypothetical protein
MNTNTILIIKVENNTNEEIKNFLELLYDKNIIINKPDNHYYYSKYCLGIMDNNYYKLDIGTIKYIESDHDYKKYKKVYFNNINHYLRYLKIKKIKNKHG